MTQRTDWAEYIKFELFTMRATYKIYRKKNKLDMYIFNCVHYLQHFIIILI